MQYHNKREASACRAILHALFALFSILAVMAFFGEFGALGSLRFVMLGLLGLSVTVAALGGLSELDLSTDEKFVEIRCSPVLAQKGHAKTFSVDADKLLYFKRHDFLWFHYMTFAYIRHNGNERKETIGLTLMPGKRREAFLKAMRHAVRPSTK